MRRSFRIYAMAAAIGLSFVIVSVFAALAVQRTNDARRSNCLQIEALKTNERAEANESYRNLDRNLRILEIEKTPEIVAAALEQRDRTLKRFVAIKC